MHPARHLLLCASWAASASNPYASHIRQCLMALWSYWKAGQSACGARRPVFQALKLSLYLIYIFMSGIRSKHHANIFICAARRLPDLTKRRADRYPPGWYSCSCSFSVSLVVVIFIMVKLSEFNTLASTTQASLPVHQASCTQCSIRHRYKPKYRHLGWFSTCLWLTAHNGLRNFGDHCLPQPSLQSHTWDKNWPQCSTC